MKNKINNNSEHCSRFEDCSINVCPLDPEANLRNKLPGEDDCPFTVKKRLKGQKGMKLLAPANFLKVIPESNVKMLHRRNQKRWHGLRKNYGKQ